MFIFFYAGLFTCFRYINTPLKNREKLPAKYFFLTIFGDQLNYAKLNFFLIHPILIWSRLRVYTKQIKCCSSILRRNKTINFVSSVQIKSCFIHWKMRTIFLLGQSVTIEFRCLGIANTKNGKEIFITLLFIYLIYFFTQLNVLKWSCLHEKKKYMYFYAQC